MTDRLRTLSLLERLRQHDMAAEARELATLRAHVAVLERTRSDLLMRLKTEALTVTLESAPYVGSYIRAIRNEVAQIEKALEKVAPRIAALEQTVLDQFREISTIRLALDQTKRRIRQMRDEREAREADALTLMRWSIRPNTE
ncbi:MAG: hypothetical protein NWQ32_10265 [Paracoccaceae bacterium]|nr:hypothetical protein [Paracoccaceae bacterium]